MNDPTPTQWPGVSRPNYSPIPDDYIDFAMAALKGAEFKVLMYIARRTFGFKRQSDRISLTQICAGITRKDGTVIERGTGLSRQGAVSAIRSLIDQGYIREERSSSDERGNGVNMYTIVFNSPNPLPDEAPLAAAPEAAPPQSNILTRGANNLDSWSNNLTSPSQKTGPPPGQESGLPLVKNLDSQKTVERETGNRKTDISNRGARGSNTTQANSSDSSDSMSSQTDVTSTVTAATDGVPCAGNALATRVDTLGVEFGDDAPQASRTRVTHLQREAALDDGALSTLLDEAASITRSQAHAIGKRGRGGRPLHMPYLLRTLESLLDPERTARASPPSASARPDTPSPTAAVDSADPPPINEPDEVWRAALVDLRLSLTAENYRAWLSTTRVVARTENVLRVGVPDSLRRDWLEHKLRRPVMSALGRLGYGHMRVEYVIAPGFGIGCDDGGEGDTDGDSLAIGGGGAGCAERTAEEATP